MEHTKGTKPRAVCRLACQKSAWAEDNDLLDQTVMFALHLCALLAIAAGPHPGVDAASCTCTAPGLDILGHI